jgi:hypothetical protein
VDGVRILKLLITATKRLSARGSSQTGDQAVMRDSSGLVFEAGEALEGLRRLAELQELLVEVTALIEAGVDEQEVETKLARARRMGDELASEVGGEVKAGNGSGENISRPTLASLNGSERQN